MGVDVFTIVVATVITAVATSVSAYVTWKMWRGGLAAEWDWYWSGSGLDRVLELTPIIVNNTSSTLQAGTIRADKLPVKNVLVGNPPHEKHESWPPNVAPLNSDIGPNKRASYRTVIQFDWPALARHSAGRWFRRSDSDALLRIQITLVSRSARRWRRKFTTQIPIPSEMINAIANAIAP